MLKVNGYNGLARDESTGAILAVDNVEYTKYINTRDRLKQEKQELETLKKEVSELKDMLYELLSKGR